MTQCAGTALLYTVGPVISGTNYGVTSHSCICHRNLQRSGILTTVILLGQSRNIRIMLLTSSFTFTVLDRSSKHLIQFLFSANKLKFLFHPVKGYILSMITSWGSLSKAQYDLFSLDKREPENRVSGKTNIPWGQEIIRKVHHQTSLHGEAGK